MRPYEVMVIAEAGLEESAIDALAKRATELVETHGGNVNRVDRWGRRRFAYEVHHKHEGYYVLFEVTAEPSGLDDLDRNLRLSDEVIRHKIIRIPDSVAGRGPIRPSDDIESGGDRDGGDDDSVQEPDRERETT